MAWGCASPHRGDQGSRVGRLCTGSVGAGGAAGRLSGDLGHTRSLGARSVDAPEVRGHTAPGSPLVCPRTSVRDAVLRVSDSDRDRTAVKECSGTRRRGDEDECGGNKGGHQCQASGEAADQRVPHAGSEAIGVGLIHAEARSRIEIWGDCRWLVTEWIPLDRRAMADVLDRFSPATAAWFRSSFAAPTAAQRGAWEAISSGQHTLVVAPTGSGKTLSAFLWAIDQLVTTPPDPERSACRVLYVSPLKALATDVERNLRSPWSGSAMHPRVWACQRRRSRWPSGPVTRPPTNVVPSPAIPPTSSSRRPSRCSCCSRRPPARLSRGSRRSSSTRSTRSPVRSAAPTSRCRSTGSTRSCPHPRRGSG